MIDWIAKVKHWNHMAKYGFAAQREKRMKEDEPIAIEDLPEVVYIPKHNLHVMVDIETWGLGQDATIISIAAAKWSPQLPWDPGQCASFHVGIKPRKNVAFAIDPETVLWWMDPKMDAARAEWLAMEKTDIGSALFGFAEWYGDKALPTWSNGATFDLPILERAFSMFRMTCPWKYQQRRCFRTMKSFVPYDELKAFEKATSHNALSDALWQAEALTYIVKKFNINQLS